MSSVAAVTLTPAQGHVLHGVLDALAAASVVRVECFAGAGTTTVMKRVAADTGGRILDAGDWLRATAAADPYEFDTAIARFVDHAFASTDVLVLEQVDYIPQTGTRIGKGDTTFDVVLHALVDAAHSQPARRLIFTANPKFDSAALDPARVVSVKMPRSTPADYDVVLRNVMGPVRASRIDTDLLYRFATELNLYQLRIACAALARHSCVDTPLLVEYLREYALKTNTSHKEIEKLSFDDLPGFEEIARKLEVNVVLPMLNPELARVNGLKPMRGVLLYGPPGTGKTSVGRALAQRMRGKFFLIDGNFQEQPAGLFFHLLERVVADAQANAPCVLFIDDADVLFAKPLLAGLTRFLLSLLDGLESGRSSNVCVMLTAMDVKSVPDALLRSGRVELWLETRVPDTATCARILQKRVASRLPGAADINLAHLGRIAEGFTPADLRRVAEDALALYGYDMTKAREPRSAQEYLEKSIENLREGRRRMAAVLDAA
jgi:AAA+ superfamily predicted ATPase